MSDFDAAMAKVAQQQSTLVGPHGGGLSFGGEARLLWNAVLRVPSTAVVLELGSYMGAMTALIGEAMRSRDDGAEFQIFTVNNLCYAGDAERAGFERTNQDFALGATLIVGNSVDVPWDGTRIDLLVHDGTHEHTPLAMDCARWLPLVVSGGYAFFHDYDGEAYPAIRPVVDRATSGWTKVDAVVGAAVFQKV